MTPDQLRQALKTELDSQKDAAFTFMGADPLNVPNAMLVPDEDDHLVKLTDGKHVYVIDAEAVCWVKVG